MLRDLTLTSIYDDKQLETPEDDVMQAMRDIREYVANMSFLIFADGFEAAERRLMDLLPPDAASAVHAHIQIPSKLNYGSGELQILQIRTFSIQGVELGRSMASIRLEDNKLISEVTTEWYLDETQLRNLRIQGDLVFPA